MSESKELQDEEKEALTSIYEGDDYFKEVTPTNYNYKVQFLHRTQTYKYLRSSSQ